MRKLLTILLMLVSISLGATVYYVATDGNDATGDGSIGTPYATPEKAWSEVSAGDTIYIRGGIYNLTTRQDLTLKNGLEGSLIYILAYPSEQPIFTEDATFNRNAQGQLFLIDADYIYIRGLEISYYEQVEGIKAWSPIQVDTCRNGIFELLNVHHNGMGMIIQNSDDLLVLNSDFHHNYDVYGRTPFDGTSYAYNDADGLVVRNASWGDTATVRGCRFWNNADDGLDLWGNDGFVLIDRCWSWKNGYREDGATEGGDGGGFKMGETVTLDTSVYGREIRYCLGFGNRMYGITQNGAVCKHYVYNNTMFDNHHTGFMFSSGWGVAKHIFRNNIAYGNDTYDDFIHDNGDEMNNTWDGVVTVTTADFRIITTEGMGAKRAGDGSLPKLNNFRLIEGSDLIDAGVDVGLNYDTYGHKITGTPDIGAMEYGKYTMKTGNTTYR